MLLVDTSPSIHQKLKYNKVYSHVDLYSKSRQQSLYYITWLYGLIKFRQNGLCAQTQLVFGSTQICFSTLSLREDGQIKKYLFRFALKMTCFKTRKTEDCQMERNPTQGQKWTQ